MSAYRCPQAHFTVLHASFASCVLCSQPSLPFVETKKGDAALCETQSVLTKRRPVFSLTPEYYSANGGLIVRADITYLQHDFAVPQPVA